MAAGPFLLAGILFVLVMVGVAFYVLVELLKNNDKPGLEDLMEDMSETEALKQLKARRTLNFFLVFILVIIAITLWKIFENFFNITYG